MNSVTGKQIYLEKDLHAERLRNHFCSSTMSAKSLGTFSVSYAVDKLHNPLPRTTMLFEGDTTSNGGRNDVFPNS